MAVLYKLYDGSLIGGARDDSTDTTQKVGVAIGAILKAVDIQKTTAGPPVTPYGEAELQYVKFSGTVVAGDWVLIDSVNLRGVQAVSAAGVAATNRGRIGITLQPQVAGQFGWVLIRGVHDFANMATAGAGQLHKPLFISAVAGRGDIANATAGNRMDGAYTRVDTLTAGPTQGNVVELYYPAITGNG